MKDKNKEKKNTPEEYGRWGKMGIKVISKPEPKPTKKGK